MCCGGNVNGDNRGIQGSSGCAATGLVEDILILGHGLGLIFLLLVSVMLGVQSCSEVGQRILKRFGYTGQKAREGRSATGKVNG